MIKKALRSPAAEGESMTIDISEEVAEDIDEYIEGRNDEDKETDGIETIETAEVSCSELESEVLGRCSCPEQEQNPISTVKFYIPDENDASEQNDIDNSSNIKIETVEHIQDNNSFHSPGHEVIRYVPRSDTDGRNDMRKNLKCDLCGEIFPCYSLLKQHKYERNGFKVYVIA